MTDVRVTRRRRRSSREKLIIYGHDEIFGALLIDDDITLLSPPVPCVFHHPLSLPTILCFLCFSLSPSREYPGVTSSREKLIINTAVGFSLVAVLYLVFIFILRVRARDRTSEVKTRKKRACTARINDSETRTLLDYITESQSGRDAFVCG